jgi:hypothetical protein
MKYETISTKDEKLNQTSNIADVSQGEIQQTANVCDVELRFHQFMPGPLLLPVPRSVLPKFVLCSAAREDLLKPRVCHGQCAQNL